MCFAQAPTLPTAWARNAAFQDAQSLNKGFTRPAKTAQAIGKHRMQDCTSCASLAISATCFFRCPYLFDASKLWMFCNRGIGSASSSIKKVHSDNLPFLKHRTTLNKGIVSPHQSVNTVVECPLLLEYPLPRHRWQQF